MNCVCEGDKPVEEGIDEVDVLMKLKEMCLYSSWLSPEEEIAALEEPHSLAVLSKQRGDWIVLEMHSVNVHSNFVLVHLPLNN